MYSAIRFLEIIIKIETILALLVNTKEIRVLILDHTIERFFLLRIIMYFKPIIVMSFFFLIFLYKDLFAVINFKLKRCVKIKMRCVNRTKHYNTISTVSRTCPKGFPVRNHENKSTQPKIEKKKRKRQKLI